MRTPLQRKQAGVTLLEVLIAVLVLAIGLLGLATLQFRGLRFGQQSYQQTQAALLAFELSELMRANRTAALAASYSMATAPAAPTANCETAGCNATQLAEWDRSRWYTKVTSLLPSGTATVACAGACGAGAPHTITVRWDQERLGTSNASYVFRFAP